MMYKLYIALVLLIMMSSGNNAFGITTVVGASADATVPPPPSGVCNGTLTMTDGGTVTSTTNASSIAVFKAGSFENGNGGIGYGIASDGAGNTTLISYDLDATPPVELGTLGVNAANSPDTATSMRPNFYDKNRSSANGKFVSLGDQIVAPCAINPCVHFRSYTNLVNVASIGGQLTAAGANAAYTVPDGSSYWVANNRPGAAPQSVLEKYNSSFVFQAQTTPTTNLFGDITSDSSFIYATIDIGGTFNIRRVDITTLAITDFALFGVTSSVAITHVNGFLYVGQSGAIQRVRTSDMTITGTLALAGGEAPVPGGMSYDTANARLYVVSSGAGATTYRRINLTTFTSEQSLGRALIPEAYGTGFDFPHQRIYQATRGANFLLTRINLCL